MGHLIRTPGGHGRRQTTEWTWGALFPHQLIVFTLLKSADSAAK